MTKTVSELPLTRHRLGTRRSLTVHRYGAPGTYPKVYVQAGLHANEIPPLLAARELIDRLDAADAQGLIRGEIVVVPVANPIGLDQVFQGELMGRFAFDGAGNFNRDYADLTDAAAGRVEGKLGPSAKENVALIRSALRAAHAEITPLEPVAELRHALLGLALDADIVLDLHCDIESLVHLYMGTELWPDAADLAAQLGARAVFLAEESGGNPFDEACSAVWWKLRDRLGATADTVPAACLSTTVELRGRPDVSADYGATDGENLYRFLVRRGAVAGDPGPLPRRLCEATPLAGVERVIAPAAGVVVYRKEIGDMVAAGEVVAEIVDPAAADATAARVPVRATVPGLLWSRLIVKLAACGDSIASIAGPEPLPGKGPKLLTS